MAQGVLVLQEVHPRILFDQLGAPTWPTTDKSNWDNRDRAKVAGGEDYEVHFLAENARTTPAQARDLIKRHGNDRESLMQEARKLALATTVKPPSSGR